MGGTNHWRLRRERRVNLKWSIKYVHVIRKLSSPEKCVISVEQTDRSRKTQVISLLIVDGSKWWDTWNENMKEGQNIRDDWGRILSKMWVRKEANWRRKSVNHRNAKSWSTVTEVFRGHKTIDESLKEISDTYRAHGRDRNYSKTNDRRDTSELTIKATSARNTRNFSSEDTLKKTESFDSVWNKNISLMMFQSCPSIESRSLWISYCRWRNYVRNCILLSDCFFKKRTILWVTRDVFDIHKILSLRATNVWIVNVTFDSLEVIALLSISYDDIMYGIHSIDQDDSYHSYYHLTLPSKSENK